MNPEMNMKSGWLQRTAFEAHILKLFSNTPKRVF